MKKNILGYCPICSNKLTAKTLRCNECDTEISGEFILSPFDFLSKEQLEFALVFVKIIRLCRRKSKAYKRRNKTKIKKQRNYF